MGREIELSEEELEVIGEALSIALDETLGDQNDRIEKLWRKFNEYGYIY